jgi:hypothetical protein
MMSNAAYSTEAHFKAACEKAGIPATTAQASKYRRGYGLAFTTEHGYKTGSKVHEKTNSEALQCQRADGKAGKINDYGPYSATPNNQNPAPLPKPKAQPAQGA